ADADDAQALLLDCRDVFGPRVDQRDVEAAFGEQSAEQATHRARPDHNDLWILKRHDLLRPKACSAHSRARGNPGQQALELATLDPRFRGDERVDADSIPTNIL